MPLVEMSLDCLKETYGRLVSAGLHEDGVIQGCWRGEIVTMDKCLVKEPALDRAANPRSTFKLKKNDRIPHSLLSL